MNDGQHETPVADSAKPRVAPRVVIASAGVVVATLFATVAALTSGSEDGATPASGNPLEDVVSKSTLRSTPVLTNSTTPGKTEVEALSSTEAPPTTTTTPRRTRVTTVTKPDGTTTTTTVDDTTPESPVVPPVYTTTTPPPVVTTTTPPPVVTTTTPVVTTTEPTTTQVPSNEG